MASVHMVNHCLLLLKQNYVGSLLDVVDGGVKDADTIAVQLDRVAVILATDVNNTDIREQMQVLPSLRVSGWSDWATPLHLAPLQRADTAV